ncbi:serine hydrolase domain-containing protein [Brevibacillus sp. NRS-1366]|uniref:serine hydrolase domain-containing protein n=1 Tax=Brevibacillus sp. NRS-1366 TaxID=3233899 RepID=UPI003D258368
MNTEQIREKIERSLEAGMDQGIFPGGAVSMLRNGEPALTVCKGMTGLGPEATPVDIYTLYDMASLTKVMVTLPLVLISVQEGKLSLTDAITTYLPELAEGEDKESKAKIKVIHLLTHTSGLPAWRPFFLLANSKSKYLRQIAHEPMVDSPGREVIYSDLGFMLLGFLLERIWDEELDVLAKRLIFEPSGMIHSSYLPLAQAHLRELNIAPTEKGNSFEGNMAVHYLAELSAGRPQYAKEWQQKLGTYTWRKDVICGTVHDCNAYYGLGGVSGHAGLFSTLADVQRYMQIWTSDDAPVRIDAVLRAHSTRSLTDPSVHRRGLGWIISSSGGSLAQVAAGCSGGDVVSGRAFGHTGFTGTSIWSDPAREVTVITLTNRVHPEVSPLIGSWRMSHHNQLFSGVGPVGTS